VIKDLKANLEAREESLSALCEKYEETEGTVALLEEKLSRLNRQLHEQMVENEQLLDARQQQEKEFEIFSQKLEERVRYYKSIMDDRQRECDEMKEKYESLVDQIPGIDVDSEQSEIKRLMDSIKERDEVIMELQEKLELVSTELMDSTELLNKIGREREENLQVIFTIF
jgi:chromosome segregation ATPase